MNEIRIMERDDLDEWQLDLKVFNRIMAEKGLVTNEQCAEAIGMDESSVSKIRRGKFRPGRKFILGTASIGIPFAAIFSRRVAP